MGRVELLRHLRHLVVLAVGQPFAHLSAVGRQAAHDVEEVGRYRVALLLQQAADGQRVATVVARSGKDDDGHVAVPPLCDGPDQCACGPLHEVGRAYGLMLYRIFVQLTCLGAVEYLHSVCKSTKKLSNSADFC